MKEAPLYLKVFKNFDQFGFRPTLRWKRRMYTSILSGIISLLMLVVLTYYIIYSLRDFLQGDPSGEFVITKTANFHTVYEMPRWCILMNMDGSTEIDARYLELVVSQVTIFDGDQNPLLPRNYKTIPLSYQNASSWAGPGFSSALCPSNFSTTIEGSFGFPRFTYISIELYRCHSRPDCVTPTVANSAVQLTDFDIIVEQPESGNEEGAFAHHWTFATSLSPKVNLYFLSFRVEESDRIGFGTSSVHTYLRYDRSDTLLGDFDEAKQRYGKWNIRLSSVRETQRRVYTQVLTMLGNWAALWLFLTSIFYYMARYNESLFYRRYPMWDLTRCETDFNSHCDSHTSSNSPFNSHTECNSRALYNCSVSEDPSGMLESVKRRSKVPSGHPGEREIETGSSEDSDSENDVVSLMRENIRRYTVFSTAIDRTSATSPRSQNPLTVSNITTPQNGQTMNPLYCP